MRPFGRPPTPALWITGFVALVVATWFGLMAALLTVDAAQYQAAPNCSVGPVSTADCVVGVYATADVTSRHSYGVVVITEVVLDIHGDALSGDIVDPPWGVTQMPPGNVVAATSWEGRLTAINVNGSLHHTWQNPYTAWQLLTWLAGISALVGLPITLAYLTRVSIQASTAIKPRRPWRPQLETIGIGAFFIVSLVVGSVANPALRFVLLAIGWAGLSAFLITAIRGTVLAWLKDWERVSRSAHEYAVVTASRVALGTLVVTFILLSAVNVTRYALT
jgi:hypothetical protein